MVVALVGVAALLRAGPLGPSSLWLDDAWVALAHRADGPGELLLAGVTAPGFTAGVALVLRVAGFSEVAAQSWPFVAGLLGGPVLWLVARRIGLGRLPGLVAAAAVVAAPIHVVYSTRVKAYTTDVVLAAVVLLIGWLVVERPGDRRRWAALVVAAAASTVVSAATVTAVAGAFAAGLLAVAKGRGGGDPRRAAATNGVVATGVYGAFALVWWAVVVRRASTPALRDYWGDHYSVVGGLDGLLDGFSPLPVVVTGAALLGAAATVAWWRPLLAVLVLVPVGVTAVLATLELAPFGGGRTDSHLYAPLALLLAAGAAALVARASTAGGAVAAAAIVALAVAAGGWPPDADYPDSDIRPLVERLEREARPGEGIAVYASARWAFALYTSHDIDLVRDTSSPSGHEVVIEGADVHVLPAHRDDPDGHRPSVRRLADRYDRLWLVASHIGPDLPALEQLLAEAGYAEVLRAERPGAVLTRWERG